MIEVKITSDILKEAEKRNNKYESLFGSTGTHRLDKNRQRMTGYLAEACIKSIFSDIMYSDGYEVDFTIGSKTIDSKAQGCNVKPLAYYSATLYEEQKNRNVDYYIFSRVKNDFNIAWICGIISKKKFFQTAELKLKGTQTNNFTYDQSRYELPYSKLGNLQDFIPWFKENYEQDTN